MNKYDEFPIKPDYEAKYKALEQAVKDAIESIESIKGTGNYEYNSACEHCLGHLTEKTGITA